MKEIVEEPIYVVREQVEIIEEKINVETLEPIEEEFVAVSPINIPSSPCVPLVSSSVLEEIHIPMKMTMKRTRGMNMLTLRTRTMIVRFPSFRRRRPMHLSRCGAEILMFMSSRMLGRLT